MNDSTDSSSPMETSNNVSANSTWPRFRIFHILHATAVVAAAIALFGPWGITWALLVFAFWLFVHFNSQSNMNPVETIPNKGRTGFTWGEVLAVLGILFILWLALAPNVGRASFGRHAARRVHHLNTLRQIAMAIHNYEAANGTLPPAYVADENGKPMHSWRVLILPYLNGKGIYDKYDFDEPWDGPNNKLLASKFNFYCDTYLRVGTKDERLTAFKLVTGEGTAFVNDKSVGFKNIIAGTSNTIMLMDDAATPVNWMSPEDINIDDAVDTFSRSAPKATTRWTESKFNKTIYDFSSVALMDGSVHNTGILDDSTAIREFMTIEGDPKASMNDLEFEWVGPETTAKAEGYILLALNIALAIVPVFWVGKQHQAPN